MGLASVLAVCGNKCVYSTSEGLEALQKLLTWRKLSDGNDWWQRKYVKAIDNKSLLN